MDLADGGEAREWDNANRFLLSGERLVFLSLFGFYVNERGSITQ